MIYPPILVNIELSAACALAIASFSNTRHESMSPPKVYSSSILFGTAFFFYRQVSLQLSCHVVFPCNKDALFWNSRNGYQMPILAAL